MISDEDRKKLEDGVPAVERARRRWFARPPRLIDLGRDEPTADAPREDTLDMNSYNPDDL